MPIREVVGSGAGWGGVAGGVWGGSGLEGECFWGDGEVVWMAWNIR